MDDRHPLRETPPDITGKLFGDKGYLSRRLKEDLAAQEIDLVTKFRRNMQPETLSQFDTEMLRRRPVIESVIQRLKFGHHLQHTRHRSAINSLIHLLGSLIAY